MKGHNITNIDFLQINYDPQIDTHPVIRRYFDRMVDLSTKNLET